jgi:hypothetical protein
MLRSPEREIASVAKKLHPFVGPYSCGKWYREHYVRQASPLVQLTGWS